MSVRLKIEDSREGLVATISQRDDTGKVPSLIGGRQSVDARMRLTNMTGRLSRSASRQQSHRRASPALRRARLPPASVVVRVAA